MTIISEAKVRQRLPRLAQAIDAIVDRCGKHVDVEVSGATGIEGLVVEIDFRFSGSREPTVLTHSERGALVAGALSESESGYPVIGALRWSEHNGAVGPSCLAFGLCVSRS